MSGWKVIDHREVPSGGLTNIQFNSIPQTYTDLLIKCSLRSTRADLDDLLEIRPNNSSANLSYLYLRGDGSGVARDATNRLYISGNTGTANTFGNAQIYFPNYTSNVNKAFSGEFITENAATTTYFSMHAMLWSNTSPISSMTLVALYGNFLQYSSATLYGMKAGSSGGVTVS